MGRKVKRKGIYLVTEKECLLEGSGAFRHIEVGLKHLSQHFDLEFWTIDNKGSKDASFNHSVKLKIAQEPLWKKILKSMGIWGTLKDLILLYQNHRSFFPFYRKLKHNKSEFIYERAAYLNFNGIIASKLLGIAHFYENNGLHFRRRKETYYSWFFPIARFLEKENYRRSNFVFFVGLWGDKLSLKTQNWMNIENGIEREFVERFKNHKKEVNGSINICFVGSLMNHHNLPLLIEALRNVDNPSSYHFHLIGSKFTSVIEQLEKVISITDHGYLNRNDLVEILEKMHIGIIPGANNYQSQMKLFDYGASKCFVIAPDLLNINYWFNQDEIAIFQQDNCQSLSEKLNLINADFIKNNSMNEKLYKKIESEFTWDRIFKTITSKMKEKIDKQYSCIGK